MAHLSISCETFSHPLNGYIRSCRIGPTDGNRLHADLNSFLQESKQLISAELGKFLADVCPSLKFQIRLKIEFYRATDADDTISAFFNSRQKCLLIGYDAEDEILDGFTHIQGKVEQFQESGSNWVLRHIHYADLHIAKYEPITASSYIALPARIANRKAVVNVQNHDNKCFMWCILAALHPANRNAQRISNYQQYQGDLNFFGIDFPVQLKSIPVFEIMNGISVNIYAHENDHIFPIYISKSAHLNVRRIHLLLLKDEDGEKFHYCWIKSLSRLLYNERRDRGRKYFCPNCLSPFQSLEKQTTHTENHCTGDRYCQRVQMPCDGGQNGTTLQFRNHERTLFQPYVLYADFECLTEKYHFCKPNPKVSGTTKLAKHTTCGFCLIGIRNCCTEKGSICEIPIVYRSPDVLQHFFTTLLEKCEHYLYYLSTVQVPPVLTTVHDEYFHSSTDCYICRLPFTTNCVKVRDHCHICGDYRGAAHAKCNLELRLGRNIVVILHNLRRYDSHLIMQELGGYAVEHEIEINCIPKGSADYLSFSLKPKTWVRSARITFIDSYQFLSASLGSLVENLKSSDHNFDLFRQIFADRKYTPSQTNLLLRKGVYPYSYMDSWNKFDETELPPIAAFYNILTDEHVSESDYDCAINVYHSLQLRNLGEYHDVYLLCDTALLLEVFEKFRKFCLQTYDLDPVHYITLPSFSWDACLKMTNVHLDLLEDVDMYTFFEKGIRGGISTICCRYAHANNSYTAEGFANPDDQKSYIIYLDANNLYGWSMMQCLPEKNFRWISETEANNLDLMNIEDNGDTGYVLEVDLEYPNNLHEYHNDYPVAPENLRITSQMLSPHSRMLKDKLGCIGNASTKLTPNLFNKEKYIIHHRNLKLYISLGLKLTKIHRGITFSQSNWMGVYIGANTELRRQSQNNFEKDLLKLLNNSVFGKSMENVRRYVDVRLATTEKRARKLIASPRFKELNIFDDNLVAISLQKSTVKLCKPIYVGFTVLDLSKLLMYNFHYNHIKRMYPFPGQTKLLFTDTDSLCYLIFTPDVYADMKRESHLFDTSSYPLDHDLYSVQNAKVVGKMKDETSGVAIEEFVGLRAKMYSLKYGNDTKKRLKGITKSVVKKKISHADYRHALENQEAQKHEMVLFSCENHHISTVMVCKTSLSVYDDKRFILDDGIHTLAYGHCAVTI